MTKTEYDQKRAECWEEYCKTHPLCNTHVMRLNLDWIFDRAFAIGKQAAELSSNSEQLNAEGEDEMLWVSRKEIQRLVEANDVVILEAAGIDNIETIQAKTVNTILNRLFGSKCLPDELNEDNFAKSEPRFKVGDKAKFRGQEVIVTDLEEGGYVLIHTPDGSAYGITESDLEPYTEPGKEPRNLSQETANCYKEFDTIIDSFAKERRLNIAAMAMQGILSNIDLFKNVFEAGMETLGGDDISYRAVAKASFLFADALVSEAEKGGEE